jgi:hypothetical protein
MVKHCPLNCMLYHVLSRAIPPGFLDALVRCPSQLR